MFTKKSLLALFILGISKLTLAQGLPDIELGYPGHAGSGCPAGTASVTLSPDLKSLSILFDQYVAQAGPMLGKTIDRKTCNVAIPIHVPQGFSIAIINVDYRGFVSLPSYRASAQFASEYFFAGSMGPRFTKMWNGPVDTDYLFNNVLGMQSVVWSPCGADVNMRVNTSMLVKNLGQGDALASVDSADFKAGLVYQIAWRSCY